MDSDHSQPTDGENADGGNAESLDKIREILFGNQSRDIDVRFQQLEDRISESIGGLRALLTERADSMVQQIQGEVQQLRDQFESRQGAADRRRSELDERLIHTTNDLRQQVGALSENLSAAERLLRDEVSGKLSELGQQLSTQMNAARDHLQGQISQISSDSVPRKSFGDALRQLADQFDGR